MQTFVCRHFCQLHDSSIMHAEARLLDEIERRRNLTTARTVQSYACL